MSSDLRIIRVLKSWHLELLHEAQLSANAEVGSDQEPYLRGTVRRNFIEKKSELPFQEAIIYLG